MKTFAERRTEALAKGQSLTDQIKAGVDASQKSHLLKQLADVNTQLEEISTEEAFAKAQSADAKRLEKAGAGHGGDSGSGDEAPAKSLGDHFVKHVGTEGLTRVKSAAGASVAAPEFTKDLTTLAGESDIEDSPYAPWLTQTDRELVRGNRRPPVIADLLGTGTLSGSIVRYFLEGALTGQFQPTAENTAKPQISLGAPSPETDHVKTIAAWFRFTEQMLEDLPFVVSEINNRGLYELAMTEENQLLNGDGEGENLLGLRNRDGIQQLTADDTGSVAAAEALFQATGRVQTATGLQADAIIINPLDYERIRLSKDSNGQYMGGGFFQGQYGNGAMAANPPIWGRNTVVSAAAPQGTALVGAFRQAATLYRKGGVRVESTNSHAEDFTHNRIVTRIEERIALAVRRPAAIVEVALEPSAEEGGQ